MELTNHLKGLKRAVFTVAFVDVRITGGELVDLEIKGIQSS